MFAFVVMLTNSWSWLMSQTVCCPSCPHWRFRSLKTIGPVRSSLGPSNRPLTLIWVCLKVLRHRLFCLCHQEQSLTRWHPRRPSPAALLRSSPLTLQDGTFSPWSFPLSDTTTTDRTQVWAWGILPPPTAQCLTLAWCDPAVVWGRVMD